jgi:hypothetical protein
MEIPSALNRAHDRHAGAVEIRFYRGLRGVCADGRVSAGATSDSYRISGDKPSA